MSFIPTSPGTAQGLFTVAIVALIAWRLYSRVRRSLGRQRLSARRPWITITILPLVILLLALQSRAQPSLFGVSLACGVVAGVVLGALGLRLTRFEASADTLLLVATLAGYYVTYAIGLVRWSLPSRHLAPESP